MNKLTRNERRAIMYCRGAWREARESMRIPRGRLVLELASDIRMLKYDTAENKGAPAVGRCIAMGSEDVVTEVIIQLSRKAIAQNPDDMLLDTIPHEIAHAVCNACGWIDEDHGDTWGEICERLGGKSSQFYNEGTYNMRVPEYLWYARYIPGLDKIGTTIVVLEDV